MQVTFDDITRRYEAELAAARPLVSADQLPLSYEAITPAWLTAVLAGGHAGAAVEACRLSEPDEGTSSRRIIYLEWNAAGRAGGLPASVFCKGTLQLGSRFMLALNGGVEAEVAFYNTVRPQLDIEAPRAWFANFDAHTYNSIIILHDMSDSVEFGRHDLPMSRARAESQMRVLARLHARYYESPALASTLSAFNSWENYFAVTVRDAGFGAACPRGFAEAVDVIPPSLYARAGAIWPATLRSVEQHSALPRMLIHSDVHLKNWYVAGDDRMGLNDWQCACKGNGGRDLAYCIGTALDSEDRRAWERDLLALYLDELRAHGAPAPDFDTQFRIYRQQLFNALAWWTGTLGQPPEAPAMQPRASSLVFIGRMATAIDDLDALSAFD